jgi:hypothetical protein
MDCTGIRDRSSVNDDGQQAQMSDGHQQQKQTAT